MKAWVVTTETDDQKRARLLAQCPELTDEWLRQSVKIEELARYAQEKPRR